MVWRPREIIRDRSFYMLFYSLTIIYHILLGIFNMHIKSPALMNKKRGNFFMPQLKMDLDTLLQSSTEHIEIIHEYKGDGWITLANKKGKYKQRHYKYEKLVEELQEVIDVVNVYVSQNTFYKPQRRIETLRQLRACYIDLDCYKTKYSKDAVIYLLEKDYFNTKIPRPNLVINSGRGLYLIWLIEPVPYMALPLWRVIQKYLYEQIKEFGADKMAIDPTRVLRLVGTINAKTNTRVEIIDTYDYRYTLREIQQEYLPELNPNKEKKKGRPKKIVSLFNEYSLYHARILDITKLCELREWELEGYREVILFLYRYWTCCFTEDPSEALERAIELNDQFKPPLPSREVEKDTESAENAYKSNKKEYKYKNSTLIELLGITEEEQRYLRSIIGTREKYRRNNERRTPRNKEGLTSREQSKQDKVKQIKKLLKKGYKQVEIAKLVGISKGRVSQYIKEFNLKQKV